MGVTVAVTHRPAILGAQGGGTRRQTGAPTESLPKLLPKAIRAHVRTYVPGREGELYKNPQWMQGYTCTRRPFSADAAMHTPRANMQEHPKGKVEDLCTQR